MSMASKYECPHVNCMLLLLIYVCKIRFGHRSSFGWKTGYFHFLHIHHVWYFLLFGLCNYYVQFSVLPNIADTIKYCRHSNFQKSHQHYCHLVPGVKFQVCNEHIPAAINQVSTLVWYQDDSTKKSTGGSSNKSLKAHRVRTEGLHLRCMDINRKKNN